MNFDFATNPNKDGSGFLTISICEVAAEDVCESALETEMDIDRVAPSVLGNGLPSGKPVHIFVQEMA